MRFGRRLEEAFGIAWERAAEEVSVSEEGQSELFEELIRWARFETKTWGRAIFALAKRSERPSLGSRRQLARRKAHLFRMLRVKDS